MTTDEALARLRPGWAIERADDGWTISLIVDDVDAGKALSALASGSTLAEAIAAAEAQIEQQERERAERRADYEQYRLTGLKG